MGKKIAPAVDPAALHPMHGAGLIDAPLAPSWSHDQLKAVKHLGPAIIGQAMYDAAQAFVIETHDGALGPALTVSAEEHDRLVAEAAKRKATPVAA